jgi:hypothetical protein
MATKFPFEFCGGPSSLLPPRHHDRLDTNILHDFPPLHLSCLIPFRFSEMASYPSKPNPIARPPVPILNALNEVPLTHKLHTGALQSDNLSVRSCARYASSCTAEPAWSSIPRFASREHRKTSTKSTAHSFPSIARPVFPLPRNDSEPCIAETAPKFGLGADWMNDDGDAALLWALECVMAPDL